MLGVSKIRNFIGSIALIFVVILIVIFIILVCVFEDTISGRWEIYSVRYNGDKVSLNELKVIDKEVYDDVIDNYFVLKENGNALVNFGEEKLVNWEKTDNGIILDGKDLKIKSEHMIIKYDDNYDLYFSRVSGSQSFSKDDELDNEGNDFNQVVNNSSVIIDNDSINGSATLVSDGSLVIFVKNNGSLMLDIDVEVEFYDKNGKLVDVENEEINAVATNQGGVIKVDTYGMNFSSYKVFINDTESVGMVSYSDKIKVSYKDNDDEVLVNVVNNLGVSLECVSISVVYFKDDDVVGVEVQSYYDIDRGKTVSLDFDYPYDYKNGKYISFDDFQVFINEAYSYEN